MSTFLLPLAVAIAFKSSSEFPGIQAIKTPVLSPRATNVLNTCSRGSSTFFATLSALRSD
jgi:hypothetical protein